MRPPTKTLAALLVASIATGAAVDAQQPPAKGKAQPAPPAKAAKPAATKEPPKAATAAAQPAAESKPASALQPTARPRPLPEEADHVARYDAAIAPARDQAVSTED